MRPLSRFLLLTVFFLNAGMAFPGRTDYRKAMNKNVCKKLKDNVLVYFIFVDSKETSPWTEYDIRTTLDSMDIAIRWLQEQARLNGIPLNIRKDYFIGSDFTTIKRPLPMGNLSSSATQPNLRKGMAGLNNWADIIARRAGTALDIKISDGIPEIQNPKNKERLVAYLRDRYEVESVALLYLVNNYFQGDISLAVNTMHTNDVEFAIVSYKYPSAIAHNILHLFGAADLSKTLFRRNSKKVELAKSFFAEDIMHETNASAIQGRQISELTKYLIGWTTELEECYHPLLTD